MSVSLITGANGFAGSHLAEYLLKKGERVICQVRPTSDLSSLVDLDVEYRFGDVTQPESLPSLLQDVEYVYHFAGKTKARTQEEYFSVNAQGTANLAQACLKAPNLKMLLYVSSFAAVGPQQDSSPVNEKTPPNPLTIYGQSKLKGEILLQQICADKIPWCIIRPTGVYGPKDRDIFIYFKTINRGLKILVSGAQRKVCLIHAADLAQMCCLAAHNSPPQEIYMASDGESYTWEQLSGIIEKALGKKGIKLVIPIWVTTPAAFLFELLGNIRRSPATLNREKVKELKAQGWVCSVEKAKQELGFKVNYPIEKGIAHTAQWYLDMGWL